MRAFKPGHTAAILATICGALALASPALAADGFGPLSGPNGCLVAPGSGSEGGTSGCGAGKGLIGAAAVAVSPDGANVYVVGGTAGIDVAGSFGSLVVLKREQSSGSISELECLSSDGTDGRDGASGSCVPTPSLLGADGVSVSPDGHTVFVVSGSSASVVAFARDPSTGSLTRLGCFQQAPRPGSPCTPANVFEGSDALVTSASGNALYVAAPQNGTVSTFTPAAMPRVGAGGPSAGTSGSAGSAGSGSSSASSSGASSGAGSGSSAGTSESAAGAAAAGAEASVASMFTTPASTVFLANPCIAVNGLDGACSVGVAMRGLDALALSPDGKQLYGAASMSGAVDVFTPSPNGMLAQSSCIMHDAPSGLCSSSSVLQKPSSLAISPDGKNVYAVDSAEEGGRLDELSRDPSTGALSDVGCVENQPPPRQLTQEEKEEQEEEAKNGEREPEPSHPAGPCQGVPGIANISAVAVSGDGTQVYAIGNGTAAIFTRDPSTGSLSESSCAASEDSRCTSLPALDGVAGAAVSPDGRQVYVAASKSNAVMVFGIGAATPASAPATTSAGLARVRVACPSGLHLPCSGTLELTRIIRHDGKHHGHRGFERVRAGSSGRFVVGPGRVATVQVRLSRRARRLLQRRRRLRTMAVVRAAPAGGGSGYGRPLVLRLRKD